MIKKSLIYVIMILDNVKNYVGLKSKGDISLGTQISAQISDYNRALISNLISDGNWVNVRYRVDPGLLELPVEKLLSKVQIEDIMLYIKLTRVNFYDIKSKISRDKRKHCKRHILIRKRKINDCSTDYQMENTRNKTSLTSSSNNTEISSPLLTRTDRRGRERMTALKKKDRKNRVQDSVLKSTKARKWVGLEVYDHEIREILLGRQKRKDELLKNSLRVLLKALKANRDESAGNMQASMRPDITKRLILSQKRHMKIANVFESYAELDLLRAELHKHVLEKKEQIMKRHLNLEEFIFRLMSSKNKSGWILQDILNSMELLHNCKAKTAEESCPSEFGSECVEPIEEEEQEVNLGQREIFVESVSRSESRKRVRKMKRVKI